MPPIASFITLSQLYWTHISFFSNAISDQTVRNPIPGLCLRQCSPLQLECRSGSVTRSATIVRSAIQQRIWSATRSQLWPDLGCYSNPARSRSDSCSVRARVGAPADHRGGAIRAACPDDIPVVHQPSASRANSPEGSATSRVHALRGRAFTSGARSLQTSDSRIPRSDSTFP